MVGDDNSGGFPLFAKNCIPLHSSVCSTMEQLLLLRLSCGNQYVLTKASGCLLSSKQKGEVAYQYIPNY